ncbi:MAG: hypothetical protein H0T84_14380 [Tatlockia sp.]|nr:hypothetical protein [Tatlockia sp.]
MLNINKQIEILEADRPFEVEISGPPNAKIAVILVHGFGVKRDSRQMFTEIAVHLTNSMLCVCGDFSEIHSDFVLALPFSSQVKRLQIITEYTQGKFKPKHIVYIGHSQGCIVIAKLNPQNSKIFLLAPPVLDPYKKFINTDGWKNLGSNLNIQDKSRLVRSDLTIEVDPDFWLEFQNVNAEYLYSQLAKQNQVEIVFAERDEVLEQQIAPTDMYAISIPGANHDFKNPARCQLINIILKSLEDYPNCSWGKVSIRQ